MNGARKIKRNYARVLGERTLIINATEEELELIKKNKLQIEKVKSTRKYDVYRVKR